MEYAANAILAGSSAGGLATTLHCDRFRNYLPFVARLKCVSGGGYFIHGKDLSNPNIREDYFGDIVTYHGIAKFLPISFTLLMDPRLCIFPENLVGQIQTPLFILNSAFDQFQTLDGKPAQTTQAGAMQHKFKQSKISGKQSCYIHSKAWDKFIVNNKIMIAAVSDQYSYVYEID